MAFTLPDPGAPTLDFERPADRAQLQRTAAALNARGFKVQVADTAAHARELVLEAIPEGSEVHIALSETIRELGITDEIDESGRYDSIRALLRDLDRGNVILVVGHQKLVSDLDEGLRRVREYSLPREYLRMQGAGFPGSLLAKTLIIHHEPSARITVILVPETLGF